MRPRSLLLVVVVLLALAVSPAPASGEGGGEEHFVADDHARLATRAATYAWPASPYLAPVCFTFTNLSNQHLVLRDSAPYRVLDAAGNVVYAPVAAQTLVFVAPGQSRTGCWEGAESEGAVLPGGYVIEWRYAASIWAGVESLRLPVALAAATADG